MGDVLRFMTCGSVDDGKSTLIGHLLFDAKMLFADQEKALEMESLTRGSGGERDFSLLLDGLSAEREQGITIDVAYRYFATDKRSFIVADTPGHEEYTRNMAVAASQSELAVLLIDATKGVRTQTRRHLMICEMMGIGDYLFAVNKMDAVGYDEEVFRGIEAELLEMVSGMKCRNVDVIPVSALEGDNLTARSENMDWYSGVTLLEYLESADVGDAHEEGFVMPVQRVDRAGGKRGLQGNIAAGSIRAGDEVTVYPGEAKTTVSSVHIAGAGGAVGTAGALGSVDDAGADLAAGEGMAVTIGLAEDIDISRGRVLARGTRLKCTDMFEARILWMDEEALTEGRNYILKLASQKVNVSILKIKYGVDPDTGNHIALRRVDKNGIASVDIACHGEIVMDSFDRHQALGRFILIDKVSNATAGCGTIMYPLRRADNLKKEIQDVTPADRAGSLGQKPLTLWFTGLSGSGKSAVANELEKILASKGRHTMLLDGDNIRLGINKDLGFNDYDRRENIRRVAEIARLLNDAGIIVITAFISPFREDREMAGSIIGEGAFAQVYLSTPMEECEKRDVKGLYRKARDGEIPNFTGVGSPYEVPEEPDVSIDTTGREAAEVAAELFEGLKGRFEL